MKRKELTDYIVELEKTDKPLDEFLIGEEIGKILKAKEEKTTDKEELAEYFAFQFVAHYPSKANGWGTYYGPMFAFQNKSGQYMEFPSLNQIDTDIVSYWRGRANASKSPILANRYADLVFDLEPKILKNEKIDYLMAQKTIDTAIDMCKKNLSDALSSKFKLGRALSLASRLNDDVRIKSLIGIIIETENKFAEDDKAGLWGYAFQWLLLDNEKIKLSEIEEKELVNSLENRLSRLSLIDDPDPWRIEHAVKLLAEYYAKKSNEESLKLALSKLENAFRKNKYSNSDGMLIGNYIEKLIEIYSLYSKFGFAKEKKAIMIQELSNLGEKVKFAMSQVSTEISLKQEEIIQFKNSIFGVQMPQNLEQVIVNIANNFILRKNTVQDQLKENSQKYVVQFLVGHVLLSEYGFPIAKFGSITDDYDKHLLENFSRNLHIEAFFLRIIFNELIEKNKPEEITKILLLSPVFKQDDESYITKLLTSLWNKDYLTCCCLCIPLIEDAIRNLHRINNQSFIKANDDGGYDVLSLDRLLNLGLVKAVFRKIGEDAEYYFRVLLTERIGWNLRNNFAHGINKKQFDNQDVAFRLVHVLFCLALVRDKKEDNNQESQK